MLILILTFEQDSVIFFNLTWFHLRIIYSIHSSLRFLFVLWSLCWNHWQESARRSCRSFTLPLLMLASSLSTIQYQNQSVDPDTIHRAYSDFTSFTGTHLCVCVCSSNAILSNVEIHVSTAWVNTGVQSLQGIPCVVLL